MIARTKLEQAPKLLLGATVIGFSAYFIAISAHLFKLTQEELGKYFDIRGVLLLHVSGGAVALLTGPFQFWEELRSARRGLHRGMGNAYVLAIAVSAPCAVYLSLTTAYDVGWSYALSLQAWASVWMVSTGLAYRYARQKKFRLHKEWMVRSYLVTLAFVLSALLNKLPFVASKGSLAEVSPGLFWAGWSIPLFVCDIVLSTQRKQ
ncbi:membrane protein, putative [Labilithrix luteola]|uniref:Membrane protein, putative n=1 Tax=Labilithrix luteola TaxID=1391654 RepID=A0A0K1PXM0_9BACT|nr:DUF2306 domain-containing protein [Labilithrix luteola]AKU97889.1 membrane protein, putative [Labilithrix luteola]